MYEVYFLNYANLTAQIFDAKITAAQINLSTSMNYIFSQ